jgi:hypothetical protein
MEAGRIPLYNSSPNTTLFAFLLTLLPSWRHILSYSAHTTPLSFRTPEFRTFPSVPPVPTFPRIRISIAPGHHHSRNIQSQPQHPPPRRGPFQVCSMHSLYVSCFDGVYSSTDSWMNVCSSFFSTNTNHTRFVLSHEHAQHTDITT